MQIYVALLRAVNVGGTGKLPMADLKAMCESLGFAHVRTYIASGNVVFTSAHSEASIKTKLEKTLLAYAGKPVGVLVRTAAEIARVAANNPFAAAPGNRVVAIFLSEPPTKDSVENVTGLKEEKLALGPPGAREIYVFYGDGMADSTLKISAAKFGTARNMNTVAKLVGLCADNTSV